MINFFDLNYELGVLLYKVEDERDIEHYIRLIEALGYNHVLLDKVKEGYRYMYSEYNESMVDFEKDFCEMLTTLNLPFIKGHTLSNNKSVMDYVGKRVNITWYRNDYSDKVSENGIISKVEYDTETGDYWIFFNDDKDSLFLGMGGIYFLSDIEITPIEE